MKEKQKPQTSLKNIFIIIAIVVLLISSLLLLTSKSSNKSNKNVLFQQPSELNPAKYILLHLPKKEIFMSTLHPAASLYEDVTDEVKVEECFNNLEKLLKEKNIELITVRSALKLNRTALKNLAFEALKYELDDNVKIDINSSNYEQFMYYLNDSYKPKF